MKQISLELEEQQLEELKLYSKADQKDYSEVIRDLINQYIEEKRKDSWNRYQIFMDNVEYVSPEEEKEIMEELSSLSDDELKIVETEVDDILLAGKRKDVYKQYNKRK